MPGGAIKVEFIKAERSEHEDAEAAKRRGMSPQPFYYHLVESKIEDLRYRHYRTEREATTGDLARWVFVLDSRSLDVAVWEGERVADADDVPVEVRADRYERVRYKGNLLGTRIFPHCAKLRSGGVVRVEQPRLRPHSNEDLATPLPKGEIEVTAQLAQIVMERIERELDQSIRALPSHARMFTLICRDGLGPAAIEKMGRGRWKSRTIKDRGQKLREFLSRKFNGLTLEHFTSSSGIFASLEKEKQRARDKGVELDSRSLMDDTRDDDD